MSDTIVIESDDEFTVIELTEQGPAGPSGSSVPATTTSLGGIIASGHFWIAANGTLYLANQTSTGAYGNATHVSHIEVDTQGRVIAANPVLITPDWTSIQNRPSLATVAISGLYSDLTGLPNLNAYQLTSTNTWANLTGRPNLAAVATSGLYSDLTGTPNLSLYLTVANATTSYYPLTGNPSGFLSSSALTPYQTIANNTFANLSGAPNISLYAPLANPTFTGNATAPTAANGTATTQLATTAFTANATAALLAQPGETPPSLSLATNSAGTFARAARADHQHADRVVGTAGTYGGAASVPVFTTDTTGRVTSVTPTAIQIDAANVTTGTLANARLGVGGTTLTWASPTTTWACNFLQTATLTLSGSSTTLSPSGHVAGGTYVLILKQDATGNRAIIWSGFKWPSGTAPTISTAANSIDILTFVSDGTSLYGVAQKAFA